MSLSASMLRVLPLLLALISCGLRHDSVGSDNGDRGSIGKADLVGTCEGACGGKSDGTCWCDNLCVSYGDCCSDVGPQCGIGPDAGLPEYDAAVDGGSEADAAGPDAGAPTSGDVAFFYGNAGTWGWLGLADDASLLKTPAQVSARFDELCDDARAVHPDGADLPCHADLIAVAPTADISKTQAVAEQLIADHGASISLDLRTRGSVTFTQVRQKVASIFAGNTSIVSEQFLRDNLVGLSLDLEPQVVESGWRPSAAQVNAMCDAYRDTMISYGHDASDLWCFLYEFGHPTMVLDGENLDPWVFPILMSGATRPRVLADLNAMGLPATPENLRDVGLDIKEAWIDEVDAEYSQSGIMGCMLFTAPYLTQSQRDMFDFADAIGAFDDKCDIWSFQ